PLRAPARGQAAGARVHGDGRHPDDLPRPADHPAVHRPQPGAQPPQAADRHAHRHHGDRGDGVPHDRGRDCRLADRDRDEGGQAVRAWARSGGLVGLPRLPQDRRQRERRPRTAADQGRRPAAEAGDRADADQPDPTDAVVLHPAATQPEGVQRARQLPELAQVSGVSGGRVAASSGGTLPEEQVRAMFDRIARNYSDLARGLAEMARVVRPGGRVVVLEITTPAKPPLSWFFRAWFDRLVPFLGRMAGDPEAYSYLPSSVRRFPDARGLAAAMTAVGLVNVRWILTAGGIIAIHAGEVEAE